MKRILSFLMGFVALITATGCDFKNYPSEADMEYMVSSLGFDKSGETVLAFAEIIVVNSSDNKKAAEARLFSSSGKTVEAALYKLNAQLSKPLMLKHCGLLALGEELDSKALSDIYDFCFERKDVTQAIEVVATEKTEKLLSLKSVSTIALGYEISTAIKQNSRYTGIEYKSRFYEIEAKRQGKSKSYALPFLQVEDEKYEISGFKIYKNDKAVFKTDLQGAVLYSLVSNSYKSGICEIDGSTVNLKLHSVKYNFEFSNGQFFSEANVYVIAKEDDFNKLSTAFAAFTPIQEDIYMLEDSLYSQDSKLYKKLEDNYSQHYKNGKISFVLRRKKDE